MYRLLIVDDEKWEREGLRDSFDWDNLGIEVAGCACNGVEGLEMAELYRPDIIITDIVMPKIDGIKMSQSIRAFLPDAKIIILSGFDDFQYAKQSFGFHAYAYVLKPIEKKSLEDIFFSLVKVLEHEKSQKKERDVLERQWISYVNKNKEYLLCQLLEREMELKLFYELAPVIGLKAHGKKVVAIMTLCKDPESLAHTCISSNKFNNAENFNVEALQAILKEMCAAFSFTKPLKEIILCMDAQLSQSELETELMKLLKKLENELGIKAVVGVGEIAEDLADLSKSYIQAKKAHSFRFLAEFGELLLFSRLKQSDVKREDEARPSILKTKDIITKIVYSIQNGDINERASLVNDYLLTLREHRYIGKMLLKSFFARVISALITELFDSKYEKKLIAFWIKKRISTDPEELDSISHTRQFIMESLENIAELAAGKKDLKSEDIAKKVIEIVRKRYVDELDLKTLSEEIHVSPYYIGSIFKKFTGKAFNKYLNDYRMDIAREMLHSKRYNVRHLGETVGIQNFSYFCTLFKSRFGINPGEYRELIKGKRQHV